MLGAVARYALGGLVHRLYDGAFPLGTLAVNTLGCIVIGLLTTLADDRGVLSSHLRLFLFIGILGGFTTFSSFGYETFTLLRDGLLRTAFANVVANTVLGLGGVWLGHVGARLL
jgi:CrcB protein